MSRVLVPQRMMSLGVLEIQRIATERRPVRHRDTGTDGWTADVAKQARGADVVEESRGDALGGEDALVAGVAERHHRFAAVLGDDHVEPRSDLGERVVPRDLLELVRFPCAPTRRSGCRMRSGE